MNLRDAASNKINQKNTIEQPCKIMYNISLEISSNLDFSKKRTLSVAEMSNLSPGKNNSHFPSVQLSAVFHALSVNVSESCFLSYLRSYISVYVLN